MAAVLAHQPGLWQHRSNQHLHFPNMNMSDFASSYDESLRTVTNPPVSRSFQTTAPHMNVHGLPVFSAPAMTTSMPYQPGAFAFDTVATNPYNMQQAFSVSYSQPMTQSVAYPTASDMQPVPIVRTARNGFASHRSPTVKSESTSPVHSHHSLNDMSYNGDYKRSGSEASDGTEGAFATHVDTLMKAIQAKQYVAPSEDAVKVSIHARLRAIHLTSSRRMRTSLVERLQSDTSARFQTVARLSTRRLTWTFTVEHTPETSHL